MFRNRILETRHSAVLVRLAALQYCRAWLRHSRNRRRRRYARTRGAIDQARAPHDRASRGPAGIHQCLRTNRDVSQDRRATSRHWNVDIGDRITKDQVLADLFVPELESQYQEKQAELARERGVDRSRQASWSTWPRVACRPRPLSRASQGRHGQHTRAHVDRWESEVERLTGMVARASSPSRSSTNRKSS